MPKPRKSSRKTVNVDAVKRDVAKFVRESTNSKSSPGPLSKSHAELAPGSVHRESPLEKEMGTAKYRDMIHGHNEKNKHILDRLPFQFPKKKAVRSHLDVLLECPNCGAEKWGTEHTVGFVCSSCQNFVKPKNAEAEARGYNPDLVIGFRGTAADKLNMKEELDKKNSQ